jgi:Protein of unknown function (DUF4242)
MYVVLRRNRWRSTEEVRQATTRATEVGDRMPDDVAWIRSYALAELDGSVGTVCIYQASSPEALRRHSAAAELPIDEIVALADAVVVHADLERVGI